MDQFASPMPNPEQAAATSELRALLEQMIEALPDGNRTVFVLRAVEGMSTAEYAIGTIAAAAFAAVLYKVVTGGAIVGALEALVQQALSVQF